MEITDPYLRVATYITTSPPHITSTYCSRHCLQTAQYSLRIVEDSFTSNFNFISKNKQEGRQPDSQVRLTLATLPSLPTFPQPSPQPSSSPHTTTNHNHVNRHIPNQAFCAWLQLIEQLDPDLSSALQHDPLQSDLICPPRRQRYFSCLLPLQLDCHSPFPLSESSKKARGKSA